MVRLLSSALQSARSHWSSVSAAEAVKIRAEILQSQSDAQLATVRYLAWAIPSIGFIGTVIGIGQAMGSLNIDPSKQTESINQSVGHLHTAFGTTFVALLLSLILMYIVHRVQADDDTFLAKATDWCMRWFVFRMYVPRGED